MSGDFLKKIKKPGKDCFVVKGNIETGFGNVVPWLFGFLNQVPYQLNRLLYPFFFLNIEGDL